MMKGTVNIFYRVFRKCVALGRGIIISSLVAEYGRDVLIFGRVRIDRPDKVYIGDNCSLNEGVFIVGRDEVRLGKRVVLSPYVLITSASMDYQKSSPPYLRSSAPVTIKDNAWLAAHVTVLPGVTIGEGAVIAAGAVVKDDIPPNVLAAGVPARVIRTLEPFDLRGPSKETLKTNAA